MRFVWLLLGSSLAAPAFAIDPELHEIEFDAARLQAAASVATPKEITPGCLTVPISTTPSGPQWTFSDTSLGETFQAVLWRKPCGSGTEAQLIVTFIPTQGSPFVCSTRGNIIQNGTQTDDIFFDTNPNNSSSDSLCGDLFVPTSVVLNEYGSALVFDDDTAFTFIYEGSVDRVVQVPAYDPSQYGQSTGPLPFSGKLSGSYFDPARSGEGVLLEIGQAGTRNVLFLSWYTYFQGQQRWIVGNVDFPANATTVTVPLLISSGGQFGSAYNPAQVQFSSWGSATLTFPTCSRLTFAWAQTAGESGTFNYQRLVDRLLGVSCP